jgi:hypothetical protein
MDRQAVIMSVLKSQTVCTQEAIAYCSRAISVPYMYLVRLFSLYQLSPYAECEWGTASITFSPEISCAHLERLRSYQERAAVFASLQELSCLRFWDTPILRREHTVSYGFIVSRAVVRMTSMTQPHTPTPGNLMRATRVPVVGLVAVIVVLGLALITAIIGRSWLSMTPFLPQRRSSLSR